MARHRRPLPPGEAAQGAPPLGQPPMPWALLAAACFGMFAASSSGTTRAPFLLEMARDLGTSLSLVGNLMAMTSVSWGIASMVAGAGSDRWGRRPFLIGGPVAMALCLLAVAEAGSFLWVALWVTVAGGCAGAFTGVLMTEASARVVDRQRGRALGWVMAGQSLTLLLGVPLAAWIGASLGWRGVNQVVAGVAVLAGLALWATTRRPAAVEAAMRPQPGGQTKSALTGPVLRLLTMGVAERICYGLIAVYFATFLQASYGLSLSGLVVPLAVFALGSILGMVLGGQLADRLPSRRLTFAGAMFGSAAMALLLFGWRPGLGVSVVLGFFYVFVNAIARPSLMAALAEVPDEVRGTVLGLNVTSASIGWLGAAALGSWMIAQHGFAGFGPLAAVIGTLGGLLALPGRRAR
ncbi:MFS transporter [Belnapia rosea]|uniref:MFS transporter, DHA1 family, arabinose polymer transporter n=1 Tax=Belnapia rosea TaxID=938405 RepID=A0A1G7A4Z5_9PROT|nr:MFS transporter [Belnapia rosea]SDB69507.1 MFS transporter, DHA1 family, arabinose polymer transporter [Belnapia rosea]SDE09125.1 MFS transporter, DHA1 family, arabinose polymer transporter [Belnapia rosea]